MLRKKKQNSGLVLYFPIILFALYSLLLIGFLLFGPLRWNLQNPGLFWFYIISYKVMCIAGYVVATKKYTVTDATYLSQFPRVIAPTPERITRMLWWFLAICFVMTFFRYRSVTASDTLLPFALPANFIRGLINPASQYTLLHGREMQGNNILTLIMAVFSFASWSLIPVFTMLWDKAKTLQKWVFLYLCFFEIALWVSVGTNKGTFDTLFKLAISLFLYVTIRLVQSTEKISWFKILMGRKAFVVATVLVGLFAVWFFTHTMNTRLNNDMAEAVETHPHPEEVASVDLAIQGSEGAFTVPPAELPPEASAMRAQFHTLMVMGQYYLTNGFYGFSLALDKPWQPTYLVGNSHFLTLNFYQMTGIDMWQRTYHVQIEEVWPPLQTWSTLYLWLANDFHFIGVIFVMLLLGAFFAITWKDAVCGNNIISQCLITLFAIIFLYIPANNQVFSQVHTFFAFWMLAALWFLFRFILPRYYARKDSTSQKRLEGSTSGQ